MSVYLIPLLTDAAAVGAGAWVKVDKFSPGSVFSAFLTGGTTPTATVDIDTSLDQVNVLPAAAGSLSVTGTAPGSGAYAYPVLYVRANVTAIAGGGTVTVQMAGNQ
jgi:hypothetical protein